MKTHGWDHAEKIVSTDDIPFAIDRDEKRHLGDESAVIYARLERDGFTRLGDDRWGLRPAAGYPELQLRDIDLFNSRFRFAITLDEYPNLLVGANGATWDAGSNLWVVRPGVVEQYTLDDLRRGTPSFSLDVDRFEPPPIARRRRA